MPCLGGMAYVVALLYSAFFGLLPTSSKGGGHLSSALAFGKIYRCNKYLKFVFAYNLHHYIHHFPLNKNDLLR